MTALDADAAVQEPPYFDPDLADPVDEEAPAQEDNSILAELRASAESKAKARHLDLPIPGYKGRLVVRYKPVAWTQIELIQEQTDKSKSPRKSILGACDILIRCCDQFYIKDDEGELIPLCVFNTDFEDDNPVRYESRVAEVTTGKVTRSARESALEIFQADKPETGNEQMLLRQATEVINWQSTADPDADF